MKSLVAVVVGLICSVLWLSLLVATNFSTVTLCAGLLIVLWLTASPPSSRRTGTQ